MTDQLCTCTIYIVIKIVITDLKHPLIRTNSGIILWLDVVKFEKYKACFVQKIYIIHQVLLHIQLL